MGLYWYKSPAIAVNDTYFEDFERTGDIRFAPFSSMLVNNTSGSTIAIIASTANLGIVGPGQQTSYANILIQTSFSIKNLGSAPIQAGEIQIVLGSQGSQIAGAISPQTSNNLLAALNQNVASGNITQEQANAILEDHADLLTALNDSVTNGTITQEAANGILTTISGLNAAGNSNTSGIQYNTGWSQINKFFYSVLVGEDPVKLIPDANVTYADYMDVIVSGMPTINGQTLPVWIGMQSLLNIPLLNFGSAYSLPVLQYSYHKVNDLYAKTINPYPNLVPNGTFEVDISGWSVWSSDGASGIYRDSGPGFGWMLLGIQTNSGKQCNFYTNPGITLIAGEKYRLTANVISSENTGGTVNIQARLQNTTIQNQLTTLSYTNTPIQIDGTCSVGGTATLEFDLQSATAGSRLYVDNVRVQKLLNNSEKPVLSVVGAKYGT